MSMFSGRQRCFSTRRITSSSRRILALARNSLSLKGEPQLDLAMKLEELEQQLARRNQEAFRRFEREATALGKG